MNKPILFFLFLVGMQINTFAQISGTVFRDYNFNGTRQTTNPTEPLVNGITVKATLADGTVVNKTTSGTTAPNYSFTASEVGSLGAVRIEFIIPTTGNCLNSSIDFSSFAGLNNGTSVQFVNANTLNVDYAISNPSDYNTGPANTMMHAPRQLKGDPLAAGSPVGALNWFLGFPYTNSGNTPPTLALNGQIIGSCWGQAYSKQAQKIFTSAFVKRHSGLGVIGSGGIYLLTPTATSYTVTQFFDMDNNSFNTAGTPTTRTRAANTAPAYGLGSSFNINFTSGAGVTTTYLGVTDPLTGFPSGLGVIGTNAQRGLGTTATTSDFDPAAFDQVGKVGIGDIDISDDGKYLYVSNLYSRKIFRLTLNDAYNPTSVTAIAEYDLPSVSVTNGVLRPFALKFHRDKLYVGAVASGENNGVNNVGGATDLFAYILQLNDPTALANFVTIPVVSYPLNYAKGISNGAGNGTKWNPWTKNAIDGQLLFTNPIANGYTHPTPMLTDIEFTDNQDMVMAFTDRSGHQWSNANRRFLAGNTDLSDYRVGGDVLIAGKSCSSGLYVLENNGSFTSANGTVYSSGPPNNQGPGNSEFFKGDQYAQGFHEETSQGALAVISGSNRIALTAMDPVNTVINSGGVQELSTTTGADLGIGYNLYTSADGTPDYTMAKANGLGDIELAIAEQPIQIGNRIWLDANGDGTQDVNETTPAVPIGTTVSLRSPGADGIYGNADDQTWTTTTDANGNYYFGTLSAPDNRKPASWTGVGNNILPGFDYRIEVAIPASLIVTQADVSSNGFDNVDNDAVANGTNALVTFNTNITNHNFDIGFAPILGSIGNYVWNDYNNNGINDEPPSAAISGVTVYLLDATNNIIDSTITNSSGAYLFDSLLSGTFYVQFPTATSGNGLTSQTTTSQTDNNSDASTATGISPAVVINTAGTGQDKDNTTIDAGYVPLGSIGNYVWNDYNNNGINDEPTSAGISGVTVYLYDALSNTILDSTITNPSGAYLFDSLISGNYYIGFPTTANGNGLTSQTTTAQTDNNSDANAVTGLSPIVTINTAGTGQDRDNTTIDAGYVPLGSIGNYVWNDYNNNGINDEPPSAAISGVTVYLLDATNNVIDSTLTNSSGAYLFDSLLSGTFYVQFPTATSGNGLTSQTTTSQTDNNSDASTATGISPAVVINTAGTGQDKDNTTIDAGYVPLGSIGNYVWNDYNNNGINDEPTSAGISGVTVYLYDALSNTILDSTITNPSGAYLFDSLISGNYYIGFPTTANGNGLTSQTTTAQTDNNSDANAVTGLSPIVTINTAGTGQDRDNTTIDAGYVPLGSIGNYVWNDYNNNGINDEPQSAAISGVTVYLLDATNNVIDSTLTNSSGAYLFDSLLSGTFYVQFPTATSGNGLTSQTTTSQTDNNSDASTATGISPAVVINTAGTGQDKDNTTIDAGYVPLGSIGNYVWNDYNNNGINDEPTSAGISGVTVYLYDALSNTILDSTITNPSGAYLFDSLISGNYYIGFPTTANGNGLTSQTTTAQADNNSDANTVTGLSPIVTINSAGTGQDRDNTTIDAGYVPLGSIGNYVWNDYNNNGINDEPPSAAISGITVYLLDATNNVIDSTLTNSSGAYLFDSLLSGTFYVQFPTATSGNGLTSQTTTSQTDNNSDASTATGIGPAVVINTAGTGQDKDNTTIDAGYVPLGSIGNYVWNDYNNNGINDEPTSAGISGVTVYLLDATNNIIDSTLTNSSGAYLFDSLLSGTFYVQFPTATSGNGLTSQTTTSQTDNNSDASTATGISPAVVINTAGTGQDKDNTTIDAGYVPLGSIGNYVWNDYNNNGINDEPTSAGISGVTVYLYDALSNTILDSTITNPSGAYLFDSLISGNYYIGFPTTANGNGLTSQTTTAQTDNNSDANAVTGLSPIVTINTAGTGQDRDNTTIDAGYVPLGSIGNYVWNDYNNNGINDEPPSAAISGVTVYLLDATNNVIDSTLTNSSGAYLFDSLLSGTFYVQFPTATSGNGLTSQTTTSQTDNNSDASTATGISPAVVINTAGTGQDKDNTTIDAGYVPLGSIGNYVWNDYNNNGINDEPTSAGISGVTVYLLDATNNIIDSTLTNSSGAYLFDSLLSGTFYVQFPTATSGNGLTSQTTTSQTDNNSDASTATGISPAVVINTAGTGQDKDNTTIDAGYVPLGSIGNYVWNDYNNNGINDEPTSAGISGVTVYLLDATNNIIDSTLTNSSGAYLFDSLLSGTFYVQFPTATSGNGLTSQTTTSQTDNNSDASTATGISPAVVINTAGTGQDKDNTTIDAGYVPLGSIGNYVWNDYNNNGINDEPTSAGISGVTVYLLDATNNIIDSTLTNSSGAYLFDSLLSGTFYVQFPTATSGNGLTNQTTTSQTDNNSDASTATGISPAVVINTAGTGQDKDNTTIDAGYVPLGSIGNYIWVDSNGNGLNDEPASAGIPNVTVYLYDGSNTIIDSTITDANGAYLFDSLATGTYYIGFPITQGGNGLTTQTSTAQTDNNSDANATTGITPAIIINTAGTGQDKDNTTIDAGYVLLPVFGSIGNYVWVDANSNGLNDESASAGIPNVTIYLYDGSNTIIDSTITDANGAYLFDSLVTGTYYVGFPIVHGGNGLTTQTGSAQTDNNSDANATTGISPAIIIDSRGIGQDKDNTTIDAGYLSGPVSLISFNLEGKAANGSNYLSAKVVSTSEIKNFNLYRKSKENSAFEHIATVNGGSNFQYVDYAITSESNAYYVEAIGIDGSIVKSNIVNLTTLLVDEVVISPNPSSSAVSVRFNSNVEGIAKVSITDMTGKTVLIVNTSVDVGFNALTIDLNALPNGNYYLSLACPEKATTSQILQKN